jgi:predicted ester cyclase
VASRSVSSLRHNLAVVLEQVPTGELLPGHAAVAEAHERLWAAFPDFQEEVVAQAANGDRVMPEWICTGTQRGEFLGLPGTGRSPRLRARSV